MHQQNIATIVQSSVLPGLVRALRTPDDDLKKAICWALQHVAMFELGREAVYKAGLLNYFSEVMPCKSLGTIEKACLLLTSLAHDQYAAADIARSGSFDWVISVFREQTDETVQLSALRACSIMCRTDENFQKIFVQSKGLPPTVQALYSSNSEMVELATFLISSLALKLDILRSHILAANALIPLNELVVGRGTQRAQLLASNAISHLALSPRAEQAIVESNTIFPIIGMLESPSEKLRVSASTLLANLSTNRNIRAKMRSVAWVSPLLLALRNAPDVKTKQGILRAIVNFSMDTYCRTMLVYFRAAEVLNMLSKIESVDRSIRAMCLTTLKSMDGVVPDNVMAEVRASSQDLLSIVDASRGLLEKVNQASNRAASSVEQDRLRQEALIKEQRRQEQEMFDPSSAHRREPKPQNPQPTTPQQAPQSSPLQPTQTPPQPVSQPTSQPQYHPQIQPQTQSPNNRVQPQLSLDDLVKHANAKSQGSSLDDLVSQMSGGQQTQSSSVPSRGQGNSLDDLVSQMSGGHQAQSPPPSRPTQQTNSLDDLVSQMSGGHQAQSPPPARATQQTNSLDDLVSQMSSGHQVQSPPPARATQQTNSLDDLVSQMSGGHQAQSPAPQRQVNSLDDLVSQMSGGQAQYPSAPRQAQTNSLDDLVSQMSSGQASPLSRHSQGSTSSSDSHYEPRNSASLQQMFGQLANVAQAQIERSKSQRFSHPIQAQPQAPQPQVFQHAPQPQVFQQVSQPQVAQRGPSPVSQPHFIQPIQHPKATPGPVVVQLPGGHPHRAAAPSQRMQADESLDSLLATMESVQQPQRQPEPSLDIGELLTAMEQAQPNKPSNSDSELDALLVSMQNVNQAKQPSKPPKDELSDLLQTMENVKQSKPKAKTEKKKKKKMPTPPVQQVSQGDFDIDALISSMDDIAGKRRSRVDVSYSEIEGQMAALQRESNVRNNRASVMLGDMWGPGNDAGMSELDSLLASFEMPKSAPQKKAPQAQPKNQKRNTVAEIDSILSSLSQSMEDAPNPGTSQLDLDSLIADLQSTEFSNINDLLKDLQ
eukprot:TRINITY_DN1178_c0_g1_i1.p1 TRINITY_DN1178_c0_g1~~TRINITY_DN1178_c0_g1_i1.p1  ORF type:complete len:1078 (-),score=180.18 TRINITY_DN1178_c0_g1_i1:64-3207(-)